MKKPISCRKDEIKATVVTKKFAQRAISTPIIKPNTKIFTICVIRFLANGERWLGVETLLFIVNLLYF